MLTKFKDIIVLKRGFDLPYHKRKNGEIPIFSSNEICGFHEEYKVKAPGVITGRSGSIGNVLFSKDNFWPLNTTLFVSDFKNNIPKYIYYFLQTVKLENYSTGTSVPTLNRNHLDNLEFFIHSLSNQQHIVDNIRRCLFC